MIIKIKRSTKNDNLYFVYTNCLETNSIIIPTCIAMHIIHIAGVPRDHQDACWQASDLLGINRHTILFKAPWDIRVFLAYPKVYKWWNRHPGFIMANPKGTARVMHEIAGGNNEIINKYMEIVVLGEEKEKSWLHQLIDYIKI